MADISKIEGYDRGSADDAYIELESGLLEVENFCSDYGLENIDPKQLAVIRRMLMDVTKVAIFGIKGIIEEMVKADVPLEFREQMAIGVRQIITGSTEFSVAVFDSARTPDDLKSPRYQNLANDGGLGMPDEHVKEVESLNNIANRVRQAFEP